MKKSKFILPITAFALLLSLGLAACNGGNQGGEQGGEQQQSEPGGESIPADAKIKITAAGDKTKLMYGETVQLSADVQGVTWESSKPEIASVSADGLVSALAKGSASIKAKKAGYKDGSISISVDYPNITVTASGEKNILVGGTVTLTASEQGVTWSSSDASVATVANGVVTGVKLGKATIKASKEHFNDGSVEINVVRPAPTETLHWEDADHFAADGWWGDGEDGATPVYARESGNASDNQCIAHFAEGDKETLTFTSSAAVRAELVMTMASSSSNVALAEVMAIKLNNADISLADVTLEGGSSSTFQEVSLGVQNLLASNVLEVSFLGSGPYLDDLAIYAESAATIAVVKPAAKEAIEVANPTITLNRGETAQINVSKPTDKTGLNYASGNVEMASVSATGLITGEGLGDTYIIISKAGMLSVRVAVTVTDQPIEGEIRVEAEDQAEGFDWEALGFHMYPDGSYIKFKHSGNAYITGYGVTEEVSLTYTVTSEKEQTMTLVIAAAPHYQMSAGEKYVFGTDATLKLNGSEITVNEGAEVVGDGAAMGAKTQNITIGDVHLNQGDNTFVIEFHGKAPALDCFKFLPKA